MPCYHQGGALSALNVRARAGGLGAGAGAVAGGGGGGGQRHSALNYIPVRALARARVVRVRVCDGIVVPHMKLREMYSANG